MSRIEDSSPVAVSLQSLPTTDRGRGVSCRFVQMLADEMVALAGDRIQLRRDCRRTRCHTPSRSVAVSGPPASEMPSVPVFKVPVLKVPVLPVTPASGGAVPGLKSP